MALTRFCVLNALLSLSFCVSQELSLSITAQLSLAPLFLLSLSLYFLHKLTRESSVFRPRVRNNLIFGRENARRPYFRIPDSVLSAPIVALLLLCYPVLFVSQEFSIAKRNFRLELKQISRRPDERMIHMNNNANDDDDDDDDVVATAPFSRSRCHVLV